jgi:hypothetical protein
MVSRDYRQEVDLPKVDRTVAWPIAVAICAVCISAAAWCAVKFAPAPAPVETETPPPAKTIARR